MRIMKIRFIEKKEISRNEEYQEMRNIEKRETSRNQKTLETSRN